MEDNWKRLSWHKRLMHTAAIVAISIYLHKLRESDETGVMSKFAERRLIPIINPSVWEQACLQRSREIEELGRLIRQEQRLIREMDDFATTIHATGPGGESSDRMTKVEGTSLVLGKAFTANATHYKESRLLRMMGQITRSWCRKCNRETWHLPGGPFPRPEVVAVGPALGACRMAAGTVARSVA